MTVTEDIASKIKAMPDATEFGSVAHQIASVEPVEHLLLFSSLYRKRAELRRVAGDNTGAVADFVIEEVLVDAAMRATSADTLFFDLLGDHIDRSSPAYRWSTYHPDVYLAIWTAAEAHRPVPVVRAFLLQALWVQKRFWSKARLPGVPGVIDVLSSAVGAHLEAARQHMVLTSSPLAQGLFAPKHWFTALHLSRQVKKPDWVLGAMGDIRSAQEALVDEVPHRAMDLVDVELEVCIAFGDRPDNPVSDDRHEELQGLLDWAERQLQRMDGMEHAQHRLLNLRDKLEFTRGQRLDPQDRIFRLAMLFERLALTAPSPLKAQMLWKKAAEAYYHSGHRERGDNATEQARQAINRADSEESFRSLPLGGVPTPDQIEAMLAPFFEGSGSAGVVLQRLGRRLVVPGLERPETARNRPRSFFEQFALLMPLVDDRSLAELSPGTPERQRADEVRAQVREVVYLSENLISVVFERLRLGTMHELHTDDLVGALSASPYVSVEDLFFIETAARSYMAGDLVSAMHVLVPRIEQITRKVLAAAGVATTALNQGALKERTFGELLQKGEEKSALPHGVATLLRVTLSDELGLNLRNRVAHGLVTPAECSRPLVERLLHIMLVLVQLRPQLVVEEAGGSGIERQAAEAAGLSTAGGAASATSKHGRVWDQVQGVLRSGQEVVSRLRTLVFPTTP